MNYPGMSKEELLALEKTKTNDFMCLCTDDKQILNAYITELQKVEVILTSIASSVLNIPFSIKFEACADKYGKLADISCELHKIASSIDDYTNRIAILYHETAIDELNTDSTYEYN